MNHGYQPIGKPIDLTKVHPPQVRSPHGLPLRVNCNLSNLVEMGGQKKHYGEIVNGHCTACGQAEFAPGFLQASLWQRIKRWLVG